jgi:hypothetical protein
MATIRWRPPRSTRWVVVATRARWARWPMPSSRGVSCSPDSPRSATSGRRAAPRWSGAPSRSASATCGHHRRSTRWSNAPPRIATHRICTWSQKRRSPSPGSVIPSRHLPRSRCRGSACRWAPARCRSARRRSPRSMCRSETASRWRFTTPAATRTTISPTARCERRSISAASSTSSGGWRSRPRLPSARAGSRGAWSKSPARRRIATGAWRRGGTAAVIDTSTGRVTGAGSRHRRRRSSTRSRARDRARCAASCDR